MKKMEVIRRDKSQTDVLIRGTSDKRSSMLKGSDNTGGQTARMQGASKVVAEQ